MAGIIPGRQPVDLFTVSIQVGGDAATVEAVETSEARARAAATEIMTDIRNKVGESVSISHQIKRFEVDVSR